jgi:hypothetical protein
MASRTFRADYRRDISAVISNCVSHKNPADFQQKHAPNVIDEIVALESRYLCDTNQGEMTSTPKPN